jgi:hypothetical protein
MIYSLFQQRNNHHTVLQGPTPFSCPNGSEDGGFETARSAARTPSHWPSSNASSSSPDEDDPPSPRARFFSGLYDGSLETARFRFEGDLALGVDVALDFVGNEFDLGIGSCEVAAGIGSSDVALDIVGDDEGDEFCESELSPGLYVGSAGATRLRFPDALLLLGMVGGSVCGGEGEDEDDAEDEDVDVEMRFDWCFGCGVARFRLADGLVVDGVLVRRVLARWCASGQLDALKLKMVVWQNCFEVWDEQA